jgi:predicted unusual protein kinase regulating ubiquinone biosynthesis (AarF/ABC1/UbiB family)
MNKYLYFFIYFYNLSSLSFYFTLTYLLFKINNNISHTLLKKIHSKISDCGCITIKIAQWINKIIKINSNTNNHSEFIFNLFHNFYEDCNIHSINYTKTIFKLETGYDFDEIFDIDLTFPIKSGSIGQVYKATIKNNIFNTNLQDVVIKIVHPNIDEQINYLYYIVLLYNYFYENNYFKNTIFTLINVKHIFNDLKQQNNMNLEYQNIEYFHNYYNKKNSYNKCIYIPIPIFSTKNILIMEYIDCIDINEIETNEQDTYKIKKILGILCIFIRENFISLDKFHPDLHDYNWKVLKNDNNKIAIFDFGLIIDKNAIPDYKNNKELINDKLSELYYAIDIRDIDITSKSFYSFIDNKSDICYNIFYNEINNKINAETDTNNIWNILLNIIIEYNIKLDKFIFNFFLLMALISYNFDTYCYPKYNSCISELLNSYLYYKELCIENNFIESINFFDKYYFKNNDYLKFVNDKKNIVFFKEINNYDSSYNNFNI